MTDVAAEKSRLLKALGDLLARVPPGLAAAGIQETRAFTAFHAKASKILKSGRGALHELESLHKQALSFYK